MDMKTERGLQLAILILSWDTGLTLAQVQKLYPLSPDTGEAWAEVANEILLDFRARRIADQLREDQN